MICQCYPEWMFYVVCAYPIIVSFALYYEEQKNAELRIKILEYSKDAV